MKQTKLIFSSILILGSIFAFTWNSGDSIYEGLLDDNAKSEWLFTTNSDALKKNLTEFLAPNLDKVDRVDGHYGLEKEYYYSVYGMKNGEATVQQVLVGEDVLCNQVFPSLQQIGFSEEDLIIYCYWIAIDLGPFTIQYCGVADEGVICGVSTSGGLCTRIRELPYEQL